MNRRFGKYLLLATALFCFQASVVVAETTIKVALITPEGSTWTETLHELAREIHVKTQGAVAFQIYAGGISGDETDVLRKMRANQIHAAGFSGVGLGVLLPEIRILESPLLFNDYAELDHVKEALYSRFSQGFEKKGMVLLGFAEAGFVYFFSKEDPSAEGALGRLKMWCWKGDPVAQGFLESFGIRTFPLHLADVNTGLETGMIDAFYASPLAAVAFQWYARIGYMMDFPVVNSTGALLVSKRIFQKISPENQKIVRELARRYCRKLVEATRKENDLATEQIRNAGIRIVSPSPALVAALKENAEKNYKDNVNRLYPEELFKQVRELLSDLRDKESKSP